VAAAVAVCLAAGVQSSAQPSTAEIRSVRAWSNAGTTRVVVELSRETKWKYGRLSNPERLFVDFAETRPRLGPQRLHVVAVQDGLVDRVRVAQKDPTTTRMVLDLAADAEYELTHLTNPERLVIELRPKGAGRGAAEISRSEPAQRQVPAPAAPERKSPEPPAAAAERKAAAADAAPRPKAETAKTETVADSRAAARLPAAETSAAKAEAAPAGTDERTGIETRAAEPGRERAAAKPAASAAAAASASPGGSAAVRAPAPEGPKVAPEVETLRPARPARDGTRSLTRALGLRIGRVVLDPGHGGHDQGTKGPTGLLEKDLVLDVALRLGALIEERLGGEVVYTRQTDVFVPLEERTAIANEHRADLFLSIHANSSPIKRVSGAEVFYLNFTTSKEALDLAARENAGHGKSIFELRELIQKIALKDKLEESREFAGFVQRELSREWRRLNVASRDRGVKKAPFVVLIGASMPSILAEIGFLSNPRDEELMKSSEHRDRLAEALYRGVERYAQSLGQSQALRAATPAATAQSMR
jgi:N-acetylmuramoyl-L-alanine amidase